MVRNRGIEVSIVSQFDVRRLPEFRQPLQKSFTEKNAVHCYVPINPGCQIWFEYAIEPPHPPNAAYFFKLLIDGREITAWDCTEKHEYHGTTTYLLERTNSSDHQSHIPVQRRGFKFCDFEDIQDNYDEKDNVIELRIHRIEHRRRVRDPLPDPKGNSYDQYRRQLQLISGGILEPGRPQRRYQYQLLDPKDDPYAIFRFYYRTYDFLKKNNIISSPTISPSSSPSTLTTWYAAQDTVKERSSDSCASSTPPKDQSYQSQPKVVLSPPRQPHKTIQSPQHLSPTQPYRMSMETYIPLSDSDDSLSVVARDSIEDLRPTVLSPESPRSKRYSVKGIRSSPERPPNISISPCKKFRKQLYLDHNGAKSKTEGIRRPLSPFTSAGFLRRILSPEPPTPTFAAATLVEPSVCDETERQAAAMGAQDSLHDGFSAEKNTQSNERSRESLMRILSRRITRRQ